ncbi:MAG: PD-(D/E)XK nuclease family protein [Acidimicrobiia bacterium]|nr:PD-(D/E)XK nuclease family protein [Acidimicrobiia bacterium]
MGDNTTIAEGATPNEITRLSPSRASDFKICPQLFKFRAIDRLPEPSTVYQARGTTAHLALQRLFDLPAPERTPEALFDLFRKAWVELKDEEYPGLFPSVEEERAWGLESLELLANYFVVEDPRSFDPVDRELDMTEDLDSVAMRGILDRIEENENGDLIIVDYKTGKAPPERYSLSAFFALKIYALLIRKRTGRTPVELRLLYLNGPDLYRLEVNEGQLVAMEKQVKALWTAIQRAIAQDQFPTRVSRLCDWCSFKEICPAWEEADEVALVGTATPAS